MREFSRILLSLLQWEVNVSEFFQLTKRKEKWSKKVSTKWKLGKSFLFKLLRKGNTLFK